LGQGVVVSAEVTQTGGTATSGADYAVFGVQTAMFDGGVTDGTVTTGAVTSPALAVQEDPLLEGSETVLLTLTNASGPATSLGDTANTTTITDNESATLSMAATSTVAEEGGAQAVGMVTLAITGTGAGAFALGKGVVMTADVSDVGTGSAAGGGVDYTFSTQTVTFDGGAADGTVPTGAALGVKLTPNNDILVEGNETVTFALGALSKPETVVATLAAVANLTTIDDNDTAAFSYATPAGVASEKEPNYVVPVVLTVTANGASGTGSLTVPVTLNWGVVPSGTTARPNVNYVPPPPGATVTFPAGADSSYVQAVSLIVKEDFIITPPMTVQLNLTLQTSLDGQLSSAPFATHVATIANSDTVMPKFEMPEPQPPAPLPVLRELSEAPLSSRTQLVFLELPDWGRGGAEAGRAEEDFVELRLVVPRGDGTFDEQLVGPLPVDQLGRIRELLGRLPDDRYRFYYLRRDGASWLIIDVMLRDGKPVDPADIESGGTDAPAAPAAEPSQPAAVAPEGARPTLEKLRPPQAAEPPTAEPAPPAVLPGAAEAGRPWRTRQALASGAVLAACLPWSDWQQRVHAALSQGPRRAASIKARWRRHETVGDAGRE
jgi:hypothetical protein